MIQLENNFVNIVLNYFYYYIAFWNVSHRFSHTMSYPSAFANSTASP